VWRSRSWSRSGEGEQIVGDDTQAHPCKALLRVCGSWHPNGVGAHVVLGCDCRYCKALLRVRGSWHPNGVGAYVVLGCEECKSTENGGAP